MTSLAISLRPQLLRRALVLCGKQTDAAMAEDMVQDVYLAFCTRPPAPSTTSGIRRWFYTAMRNVNGHRIERAPREICWAGDVLDSIVVVAGDVMSGGGYVKRTPLKHEPLLDDDD